MNATELKKRAIFVTKHGSHAYGLNTPTSDLDIKGVFVATPTHYYGFAHNVEQVDEMEAAGHPHDLVIYELRKFMRLAADCNPNIIEVLWTDPSDHIFLNRLGMSLIDLGPKFLSQKAKFTFSGYATAQLKRIKGHYRWLKNPPQPPKERHELGLPPNKNWCDYIDKMAPEEREHYLVSGDRRSEQYRTELEWRNARKDWEHYNTWKTNRNVKRSELEEKFGYDTKHGMHLVRLMRMGEEILKTGKVLVKRPDREELLAIRNYGIWRYEELVEWAEKKDHELDEYYKSGQSPLPKSPDINYLDEMCKLIARQGLHDNAFDYRQWDTSIPHP